MSGLQCGCVSAFGSACTRRATQEDVLCDECRDGRHRNAVVVWTYQDEAGDLVIVDEAAFKGVGPGPGHHHHVTVGEVVLRAVEQLPTGLRYRGDPERMTR